jgi:hypothetical protein
MQPRRVIFPDTVPLVSAAIKAAVPAATVGSKRPGSLVKGTTYVQYRNDSGPESGLLKTERYGINCWAPKNREASDVLRTVMAHFRSNVAGTGPVVRVTGGTGPYEVMGDGDDVDSHTHFYCTVELTVKGSNY